MRYHIAHLCERTNKLKGTAAESKHCALEAPKLGNKHVPIGTERHALKLLCETRIIRNVSLELPGGPIVAQDAAKVLTGHKKVSLSLRGEAYDEERSTE